MESPNADNVAGESREAVAGSKRAKRGVTRTGGRRWHEHYAKRLGGGEFSRPVGDADGAMDMLRTHGHENVSDSLGGRDGA